MIFSGRSNEPNIEVEGNTIENIERFTYLGSNLTHNLDSEREIKTHQVKAYSTLGALDKLWSSSIIKMPTKMKILNTMVFITALYSYETRTFTAKIRRMLLAFESKCHRKIMRVK